MRSNSITCAASGLAFLVLLIPSCGYQKYKKAEAEADKQVPKTITFNPGTGAQPAVMHALPAVDRRVALHDLKQLHTIALADLVVPPPASFEQWTELRQAGKLYHAVKEGHYVVCWNADRKNGEALFCWWKGTPEQGGPAVLVNGTLIENLTPAEFKMRPKAGKTN